MDAVSNGGIVRCVCIYYGSKTCWKYPSACAMDAAAFASIKAHPQFIATDEDGRRLHLVSSSSGPLSVTLVLDHALFAAGKQLLSWLCSSDCIELFMRRCVFLAAECPIPDPGCQMVIQTGPIIATAAHSSTLLPVVISRPSLAESPTLLEQDSLLLLFDLLPADVIVDTWACLLTEQRVVLHAVEPELYVLPQLSAALESLLFPLHWSTIFIPQLPEDVDPEMVLDAPQPFLVGMATSRLQSVPHGLLSGLCVLNVSSRTLTLPKATPVAPPPAMKPKTGGFFSFASPQPVAPPLPSGTGVAAPPALPTRLRKPLLATLLTTLAQIRGPATASAVAALLSVNEGPGRTSVQQQHSAPVVISTSLVHQFGAVMQPVQPVSVSGAAVQHSCVAALPHDDNDDALGIMTSAVAAQQASGRDVTDGSATLWRSATYRFQTEAAAAASATTPPFSASSSAAVAFAHSSSTSSLAVAPLQKAFLDTMLLLLGDFDEHFRESNDGALIDSDEDDAEVISRSCAALVSAGSRGEVTSSTSGNNGESYTAVQRELTAHPSASVHFNSNNGSGSSLQQEEAQLTSTSMVTHSHPPFQGYADDDENGGNNGSAARAAAKFLGLEFNFESALASKLSFQPFVGALFKTQAFDVFLSQRLHLSAWNDAEVLFFDATVDSLVSGQPSLFFTHILSADAATAAAAVAAAAVVSSGEPSCSPSQQLRINPLRINPRRLIVACPEAASQVEVGARAAAAAAQSPGYSHNTARKEAAAIAGVNFTAAVRDAVLHSGAAGTKLKSRGTTVGAGAALLAECNDDFTLNCDDYAREPRFPHLLHDDWPARLQGVCSALSICNGPPITYSDAAVRATHSLPAGTASPLIVSQAASPAASLSQTTSESHTNLASGDSAASDFAAGAAYTTIAAAAAAASPVSTISAPRQTSSTAARVIASAASTSTSGTTSGTVNASHIRERLRVHRMSSVFSLRPDAYAAVAATAVAGGSGGALFPQLPSHATTQVEVGGMLRGGSLLLQQQYNAHLIGGSPQHHSAAAGAMSTASPCDLASAQQQQQHPRPSSSRLSSVLRSPLNRLRSPNAVRPSIAALRRIGVEVSDISSGGRGEIEDSEDPSGVRRDECDIMDEEVAADDGEQAIAERGGAGSCSSTAGGSTASAGGAGPSSAAVAASVHAWDASTCSSSSAAAAEFDVEKTGAANTAAAVSFSSQALICDSNCVGAAALPCSPTLSSTATPQIHNAANGCSSSTAAAGQQQQAQQQQRVLVAPSASPAPSTGQQQQAHSSRVITAEAVSSLMSPLHKQKRRKMLGAIAAAGSTSTSTWTGSKKAKTESASVAAAPSSSSSEEPSYSASSRNTYSDAFRGGVHDGGAACTPPPAPVLSFLQFTAQQTSVAVLDIGVLISNSSVSGECRATETDMSKGGKDMGSTAVAVAAAAAAICGAGAGFAPSSTSSLTAHPAHQGSSNTGGEGSSNTGGEGTSESDETTVTAAAASPTRNVILCVATAATTSAAAAAAATAAADDGDTGDCACGTTPGGGDATAVAAAAVANAVDTDEAMAPLEDEHDTTLLQLAIATTRSTTAAEEVEVGDASPQDCSTGRSGNLLSNNTRIVNESMLLHDEVCEGPTTTTSITTSEALCAALMPSHFQHPTSSSFTDAVRALAPSPQATPMFDAHTLQRLLARARWSEKQRLRLAALVADLRGCMQVVVRIRPHKQQQQQTKLLQDDSNYASASTAASTEVCVYPMGDGEIRAVRPALAAAGNNNCGSGNGCASTTTPSSNSTSAGALSASGSASILSYDVDRVFDASSTQEDVYAELEPVVAGVVDGGKNACILAYGQTGSGKTHSLCGPGDTPLPREWLLSGSSARPLNPLTGSVELPADCGVYARAVYTLFNRLADVHGGSGSSGSGAAAAAAPLASVPPAVVTAPAVVGPLAVTTSMAAASAVSAATPPAVVAPFEVRIGMFEIYNDDIRDLLRPLLVHSMGCTCGGCNGCGTPADKVVIRNAGSNSSSSSGALPPPSPSSGLQYIGLSRPAVTTPTAALALLSAGMAGRVTAATSQNHRSSRSHCAIVLSVIQRTERRIGAGGTAGGTAAAVSVTTTEAKLLLVDLAGSERLSKAETTSSSSSSASSKAETPSVAALGEQPATASASPASSSFSGSGSSSDAGPPPSSSSSNASTGATAASGGGGNGAQQFLRAIGTWLSQARQPFQLVENAANAVGAAAAAAASSHIDLPARRLKESQHINSSLVTLGLVIAALGGATSISPSLAILSAGVVASDAPTAAPGSSATRAPHIPYRDSTLTFALSDVLGANARTVLLCTVSPSMTDAKESVSTLDFATRARRVKSRVVANVSSSTETAAAATAVRAAPSAAGGGLTSPTSAAIAWRSSSASTSSSSSASNSSAAAAATGTGGSSSTVSTNGVGGVSLRSGQQGRGRLPLSNSSSISAQTSGADAGAKHRDVELTELKAELAKQREQVSLLEGALSEAQSNLRSMASSSSGSGGGSGGGSINFNLPSGALNGTFNLPVGTSASAGSSIALQNDIGVAAEASLSVDELTEPPTADVFLTQPRQKPVRQQRSPSVAPAATATGSIDGCYNNSSSSAISMKPSAPAFLPRSPVPFNTGRGVGGGSLSCAPLSPALPPASASAGALPSRSSRHARILSDPSSLSSVAFSPSSSAAAAAALSSPGLPCGGTPGGASGAPSTRQTFQSGMDRQAFQSGLSPIPPSGPGALIGGGGGGSPRGGTAVSRSVRHHGAVRSQRTGSRLASGGSSSSSGKAVTRSGAGSSASALTASSSDSAAGGQSTSTNRDIAL